ncbi:MAG: MATE family efflux transporter, partial [Defluviitaleaceae bacterium]|nr:MATE family efflux transporter [Defluviitaleaceae bacterium]
MTGTESKTEVEAKTDIAPETTVKGKVRDLNRIALPLIIQNLSTTAILMADVAIIGRLSPAAFNAVGVVSGLFSLVAGIVGYFSVQFNIVGGKASVKDPQDFTDEFASALILNAAVGLLLFLFMLLFNRPLFALLYGFEGEMLDIAATYASIISVYLPIQLLIFSFNALFKIRRNTRWILFASVGASLLGLLLNFIFIIVLGFGVRAAGLTSVAAIAAKLLVFVAVCKKEICLCAGHLHIYRQKALAMAKGSLPLMGQELLEGGVFAVAITAVVARLGDYPLSAFIVLTHLLAFAQLP